MGILVLKGSMICTSLPTVQRTWVVLLQTARAKSPCTCHLQKRRRSDCFPAHRFLDIFDLEPNCRMLAIITRVAVGTPGKSREILTLFHIKKYHFRPGLQEIMSSLLRLEQQQKGLLNPFWIHMFLFLFYSFGIETINTFIHSRSCLENHARLQTKMGKVYTCFQSKTAQKSYCLGRYMPI